MAKRVEYIDCGKAQVPAAHAAARVAAFHHGEGRRVLVLARDRTQAEELDRVLWSFAQDSFLPHALAGGPDQEQEPVLISTGEDNPNGARVLILARAEESLPLDGFDYLVQLLPEGDGPELDRCRRAYKALKDGGGVDLRYLSRV